MNNLIKIASILDKLLKVLAVCIKIAAVALLVGLAILVAGFVFDLPPQMVSSGYDHVDVGFVTLTVADSYLPDHRIIWSQITAEMLLTLFCLVPAHFMVKAIRNILAPMKEGSPFHNTISLNLKNLARYTCFLGIGLNLLEIISNILLTKAFDLHILLLSEKMPHAEFHFTFDLSFLFIAGILLLLSCVFRYGEELQQLSDETL